MSTYKDYPLFENDIETEITNPFFSRCANAGLITSKQIFDFYVKNGHVLAEICGDIVNHDLIMKSKKELLSFSSLQEEKEDSEEKEDNESHFDRIYFLNLYEELALYRYVAFNRYYEYLISIINVSSNDASEKILESLKFKNAFEIISTDWIQSQTKRKIDKKTCKVLEKLKQELIYCKNVLKSIQFEQIRKEYTKLIIKKTMTSIPDDFDEQIENVFNVNNKIKLFCLLNYLINSGQIFTEIQSKLFDLTFKVNNENQTLTLVAKDLNLTKERVRQIKLKLEENLNSYFSFVSSLVLSDLVNYNINVSNSLIIIDNSFSKEINDLESVNFNASFYKVIFGNIISRTHCILGYNEKINGKRKIANNWKYRSCYLIEKFLFDSFDFETFLSDIYIKVNDKITESYMFQFQGYLYNFSKENSKVFLKEIYSVCEGLIFNEFDLLVDSIGYIHFERTTKKLVHEYCYDVLEESSEPMTIDQIANSINSKYPEINTKAESLRSSLNKEKEIFVYFGRTSTYGLRKWEREKANFKGGTIRDIVEEFLSTQKTPKHISDIVDFVIKYRPKTNVKSILGNLKLEQNGKFYFYRNSVIGLNNKNYDKNEFQEKENQKNWNERFIELKEFRDKNPNKWPSVSSLNKNEKSLYRFCYKARNEFKKGKLNLEKENLLRNIGFPFDLKNSRINVWKNEIQKLVYFLNSEKKWPSAKSQIKSERTLYSFCYFNKKAYQNKTLSEEQIEILKSINFNFKVK